MNKERTAPPLAVPVLLAVVGVGALATAILLVPPMVRQFSAAQKGPRVSVEAPVSHRTSSVTQPIHQLDAGVQPSAAVEPSAIPVATEPHSPVVEPVKASTEKRRWVIDLDPKSNEIAPSSDPAIDEIIAVLTSDADAKASLTGINHPNKSSKRAERAAKIVKERITADIGITSQRVRTASEQDPTVDGLIVRAVIEGGGR